MATNPDLTFERLLDWVEGRLAPAEAQDIAQQVANAGEEIQAQVQWLAAYAKLGDQIVLMAPPPTVRAGLVQRFADYAQAKQQPGFLQRLAAVLSFDSLHQPAQAGLRASESEAARQYVFTTDLADVALNIQPRPYGERLDLIGQILPNTATLAPDAFAVQLLRAKDEVAITLAEEFGEFWFEALEPGDYRLMLSTDILEIELPVFALTR
jgi:hypothetical protein